MISSYKEVGKKVPYAENAINSVLALQKPNGQFSIGSSDQVLMTINWDSMKVLLDLNNQLEFGYRFNDIKEAGNKMSDFLIKVHKKDDGGFSFYPTVCQSKHNSVQVSGKGPVGDMQGTKFCLYCFAYTDERNNHV